MNKHIPNCKSEKEERAFWAENDSMDYLDWKQAQRAIFPNLKPTLKSISLRLPESMIDELRQLANERDIPYQSLIKHFLRESIDNAYSVKLSK
ncbi:MAG: BrnA antitoxin family protein [Anaerolineales bacterium]|nr:BrnA antitoxin family protein [Anaerolineales bacterium]